MVSLSALLWIFVFIFALIGATRGWAKEMLVTFAVMLSMFITTVLEKFVPGMLSTFSANGGALLFWYRTALLCLLVFFGYQTPNIPKFAATNRFIRDRLQDSLLGIFLGAINGFLIFGSIWWYMDKVGYPIDIVIAPDSGTAIGKAALQMVALLPPNWLGEPIIYFAVAIAFAFVLVVFI